MSFHTPLHKTLLGAAVAAAAALGAPALASGAVRHAEPDGSGSACTAAAPCLLQQALDGAAARGDEIVVHGGRHSVYAGGGYGRQLSVHGADGESRPVIELQGDVGQCALSAGAESSFRRLRLRLLQPAGAYALCLRDRSVAEQLIVAALTTDSVGIRVADSDQVAIRDTSVHAGAAGGRAIVLHGSDAHLDNVSLRGRRAGLGVEATGGASVSFVRNSYLDGGRAVEMSCSIGAFATVSVAHSAVGALSAGGCGWSDSDNIGLDGTNVALGSDDALRPGGGSTLREAGDPDDQHTGPRDLDGQPRRLGDRLDIGADEIPVASELGDTTVAGVTSSSARFATMVFRNGSESPTAEYQLGLTTAYGTVVPAEVVTGGSRLVLTLASATVDGLAPGTTYHARLKLRNEFGFTTYGEDVVFTTAAVEAGGSGGGEPGPGDGGGAGDGSGGGAGGGTSADGGSGSAEGSGGGAGGGAGTGAGAGSGGTGSGPTPRANVAPTCKVRVVRARRGGRVVLRGRCSEPATLKLAVARKGRRAVTRSVVVPGGRRFAKTIQLGRLATLRRALTLTARDAAGAAARPLALRVARR